jgi:mannose-6-phosphate isomerase-like protein (cupin superfamily)
MTMTTTLLALAGTAWLALSLAACAPAAEPPPPAGPPDDADPLISGIGLTHLTVYDQRPAPDGKHSGTAHVHAVTDEGYYVMSGAGQVELHDLEHGFRTVDLSPGTYLQFPPGVIHRLVNTDHLVILVVMGNAGLAERGDARIYFGKAMDEDPEEFARLVGLPKERGLEGALERRDASIRAYQGLMELWRTDRKAYRAELERFLGVHMKAAAELKEKFHQAVEVGPGAWNELFRSRVVALPALNSGEGPLVHVPPEATAFGMCGVLRPVTGLVPVDGARGEVAKPEK